MSLFISIWKWHFFFFFNAQLSPCLIVSKLPQSLLKIFCLTLMLTLSRELAPSQMPFPKGVGFLEGTLGESAAITPVCSQEYEVCVCASKRGACPKLQPGMDPLILWASLVPPQDAITKISRCLQTLKCLGRKPSLWVDAFKKSLNCCKQNPEAIPLPLRLSQRTWGGSPVKEDEARGRLKTTEVTHRILTGALGFEGPFALWHFFLLLIILLPISLFPQSLGNTADRPACLKQWNLKVKRELAD